MKSLFKKAETYLILIICFICLSSFKKDYNPQIKIYNSSGQLITVTKVFITRVAITSAAGQSVDLSPAGFTSVSIIHVSPENNTTTSTAMPQMSCKSFTTTSALINTLVAQNTVVSILGANVIPFTAPVTLTGMYADVTAYGN